MGHNLLGSLPHSLRWREVVALLEVDTPSLTAVGSAVAKAADTRLRGLNNDERLAYCFWLLTEVASAARSDDFTGELNRQGIDAQPTDTAIALVAKIADHVRFTTRDHAGNGHYVEIAALALRQALTETVLREGPSLFASDANDVQRAFRTYSTTARFSELSRRFFANFMSRTLRGIVDRELAMHVGGKGIPSNQAASEFLSALDKHAWETAYIVEDFAGKWVSKRNWETQGQISLEDAQRFMAVALQKLRSELKSGAD
jgi:hypothetical protein